MRTALPCVRMHLITASSLLLLLAPPPPPALACDSLAVLPSATADGIGGLYGKNADRHYSEAQPVAALPRLTHAPGTTITLDSGLVVPQVRTTFAHAGARPSWAYPYGGYSEGVNEWGVGIGNEHFHSHGLPTDDGAKPQMEFTDLGRLVLERATNASQAIGILTELISEYGQTCKTCPALANYNSMFMVSDTRTIFSVMAVGHEWAWREIKEADTDGTGVWTISNCLFTGANHLSPGAISTARKVLGYSGSDADFDFGTVYGTTKCDARQVRQVRSQAFLRDRAKDHKLTKADLMLTLSDHEHLGDVHQPYVAKPSFHVATIDWHTSTPGQGDISASSMVSGAQAAVAPPLPPPHLATFLSRN
jgi:dipeptidase